MSVYEIIKRRSLNCSSGNLRDFYGNDELVTSLQVEHSIKNLSPLRIEHKNLSWSSDGRFLLTCQNNMVSFWNPHRPKLLQTMFIKRDLLSKAVFMPQSHDLICYQTFNNQKTTIYDINKQQVVSEFPLNGWRQPTIFSESQPNSLWFGTNCQLWTIDVREGEKLRRVICKQKYSDPNPRFDVSPTESHLVAATFSGSGCACLFDTRMLGKSQKQAPVKTFAPGFQLRCSKTENYSSVKFSPNGREILLVSDAGDFYLFDLHSNQKSLFSNKKDQSMNLGISQQKFSKTTNMQSKCLRKMNYSLMKSNLKQSTVIMSADGLTLNNLNKTIKECPNHPSSYKQRGDLFLKNQLNNVQDPFDLNNTKQLSFAYQALRDYKAALSLQPSNDQIKCDIVELLSKMRVCQQAKNLAGNIESEKLKEKVRLILDKYREVPEKKVQKNKLVTAAVDYKTFVPSFQNDVQRDSYRCQEVASFFGPDSKYLLTCLSRSSDCASIYDVAAGVKVKVLELGEQGREDWDVFDWKPNPNPEYCCVAYLDQEKMEIWTPIGKN